MQKMIKDIVLEILTISNYPNDKDKFVKEFEELNHAETLVNMLEKLPEETQRKLKESKDVIKEAKEYISSEDYITELTKVSHQALSNLINNILPTLNNDEKEKVVKLLQENSF